MLVATKYKYLRMGVSGLSQQACRIVWSERGNHLLRLDALLTIGSVRRETFACACEA